MRRSSALESALAFALAVALCATSRCAPRTPPTRETLVIAQVTSALTLDPHLHDEEGTSSVLSHFYNRLVAFERNLAAARKAGK